MDYTVHEILYARILEWVAPIIQDKNKIKYSVFRSQESYDTCQGEFQ